MGLENPLVIFGDALARGYHQQYCSQNSLDQGLHSPECSAMLRPIKCMERERERGKG